MPDKRTPEESAELRASLELRESFELSVQLLILGAVEEFEAFSGTAVEKITFTAERTGSSWEVTNEVELNG